MKLVATLVAACIALTYPSSSLVAQSPRALTIEDYYKIKSVGDAQISPDGKWVAFTLTTRVEEDNTNAIETFVVPADGSAAPRRITHEGKSVASPRWTDDNMLQYSLNAKDEQRRVPRRDRSAAARSRGRSAVQGRRRYAECDAGVGDAGAGRRAERRRQVARAGARCCRGRRLLKSRAPISRSGMRRDSRAAPSTGCASSRTARTIRRPIRARVPRPRLRSPPSTAASRRPITSLGMRAANVAWHPERQRDRVHGGRRVAERAGLRAARHLHRDDRRRGEAAHQRRLRVGLAVVFAGRAVPAVGAHVRHRHDHREEAVAWRLGRSDRLAGRRRRADQSHRVVGSRAERAALVAGFEVRLLHRRKGRHHAPVPRRRARRRAGRAGHEGRAAPQQRHLRQGDDAHRLQRRHLREPVRSCGRRTSTAPARSG